MAGSQRKQEKSLTCQSHSSAPIFNLDLCPRRKKMSWDALIVVDWIFKGVGNSSPIPCGQVGVKKRVRTIVNEKQG